MTKRKKLQKYKEIGKILKAADKHALKVGGPGTMQVYEDAFNDFIAGAIFVLRFKKWKKK